MISVSNYRPLLVWLSVVAIMVTIMILIGGVTRITNSGLSMVEWRPLMGWLPPLSDREWLRVFHLYQQSPEFLIVNTWMDLEAFKGIFWWEYIHRLWGRLIGIVFFVPFIFFWILGCIPRHIKPRLMVLFLLGGMQGFIGWWMVKSGLSQEPSVSQYRLALHLGVAFLILGLLIWTILDVTLVPESMAPRSIVHHARVSALLVFLTIIAGALVAGMDAGLIYNSFPLMNGEIVPRDYFILDPNWKNFFENAGAVQFNHRILAMLTVLVAVCLSARCMGHGLLVQTKLAIHILSTLVALQLVLGVSALVNGVPELLAIVHQFVAICLFASSLLVVHLLGGGFLTVTVNSNSTI